MCHVNSLIGELLRQLKLDRHRSSGIEFLRASHVRSGWGNLWLPLFLSTFVLSLANSSLAKAGAGSKMLTASPTSLSFGNVTVGTSKMMSVTLTNQGSQNVRVSQGTVQGSGFSISGLTLPFTLAAGQSTTFNATYAPGSAGGSSGTTVVTSNANNSPTTVSLSGTGVALLLGASPASLNFGNVTVGSSSTQTVTLSNTGTNSVTVSQASVAGSGFTISGLSLPLTLAAGQTASFNATFAPTVAGSSTGSISVVSNASNSPAAVSLSGTGVTLTFLISVSPSSTNFSTVVLGSSVTLPIVVYNTGTGSVTLSQATTTGTGFSISGLSLPLTLPAGQNTGFSVTFAPTTAGNVTGNISIVSNATNSPASEPLSGTGTHAVNLSWTASTSPVVGYNVYSGTISGGPYTKLNGSLVASSDYTDTTAQAGQTYYYVATAVDSNGNESAYSNQASAVVPSP